MIGGAKGIGIGIDFGIPNQYCRATSKPYIEKDVLDSLRVVASAYGKSNDDADRSIVKNLVDASNPFIISNAAFKLNSGFGEYKEDFTSWRIYPNIKVTDNVITTNGNFNSTWFIYKHSSESKINEMNIKVSGIPKGGKILYFYISDETANLPIAYTIPKDGIYHLPESKINNNRVSVGFTVESSYDWNNIRIEQIPSFEGAFVTDGINDLITSTKTVQEMLGGSTEFTAVSMVHLISSGQDVGGNAYTNYIRTSDNYWTSNRVSNVGKTGIYGYSFKQGTPTVINNILGDKNDYTTEKADIVSDSSVSDLFRAKFSVEGFEHVINGAVHVSSVAWYWTIIANKVLTTDQINQVIAYFNLDRTLKPDILCNTIKQGITNENHAEFGDRLIDFSGNGRDIQLNNIAWKGDSGIGKYEVDFLDSSIWTSSNSTITSSKIDCKNAISHIMLLYYSVGSKEYPDIPLFKVIKTGADIDYSYIDETGSPKSVKIVDGVNILPASHNTLYSGSGRFCGFGNPGMGNSVTITQIPSHAGGLCLDGINDFGKVKGMPVYKDYTVVTDREIFANIGAISSKNNPGAFVETVGNNVYSFGQATSGLNFIYTRSISYLSKYSYCGQSITAGAAEDGTDMWLGTIRDNDSRFFNGAIYSLMSFPYSMSEFLIERQLKKHKLGTLYPDMVEFRPIVKSNVKWDIIEIWQEDKSLYRPAVNDDKIGIYLKKDSTIGIYVKPYVGQKVSEIVYNGVSYTNLKLNNNGFYYKVVPITKSPQKIGITIEQDENYVLFNPVINSNYDNYKLTFHLREYEKLINIGDYIPKGTYIRSNLYLKNNIDELVTFTFNGVNIDYAKSPVLDTAYNIRQIYNYDSPQEVNITIDEYIRYEDIVQPYPVLLRFNDENGNEVSWGGKFRVGSTITRIGSAADSNLLPNIYNILGLLLNDNQVTSSKVIVEKTMVFKAKSAYIFDNNEPKCILSPRLLSIPNSSYKILGYIPDISGHGNHGVIHNSAYAEMSGANGYRTNLGNWSINSANTGKIITQREEHLEYEVLSADKNILFYNTKIENDTFVIYTSVNTNIVYSKESDIIANIPANTPTKVVCPKIGTILLKTNETPTVGNIITVKQYGIYEGAYCFDGVDDFVTIPTVTGGKQVLMKVNWQSIAGTAILYDQRTNGGFAISNRDYDTNENKVPAYRARNIGGNTYIDGILNEYIYASQLQNITHNIVELYDPELNIGTLNPKIGSSYLNSNYAQMSLYDFMLFDEISTDDKIKELNEYVGVEAKVELPPYYWDAYGKTNSDADRDTIQQRGIAVGDYDLTNYNHAYEGMSGYNGYPVVFGANKTWANESNGYVTSITSNTIHITNVLNAGLALLYSYVKYNGNLQNIKEIPPFKIEIKGLEGRSKFIYKYLATSDATKETNLYLGNGTHELPKSFLPTEALVNDVVVGFSISPIEEGVTNFLSDITIEVLPKYENGLVYDGLEDYSVNTNIPALTDYTYICKRTILNIPSNGATLLKGTRKINGGAFIADYNNKWQFYFGQYNIIQSIPDGINWQTSSSFNGTSINRGTNTDDKGITIGRFSNGYANMVLYKLILYPKTIPLLQINFLKNLMERDEIIDLNNPIFIQ